MPPRGRAAARLEGAGSPAGSSSRPVVSREFIVGFRRRRIVDAFAGLCAEKGYETTTISDLAKGARVARKTIYDNFGGKEEVLLAAFDAAFEEVRRRVEAACAEAGGGWPERAEAGLAALLGYVAERPEAAWLLLIEARIATPAGERRYDAALEGFVEMARAASPARPRLPATIDETLIGGVAWILQRRLRGGEAETAEDLLPDLTEFMLAPYRAVAGR
jgi:AcrR family transcriptional regulator